MQGVDFGCIEVNMPREGRYSSLTTKFLPLVFLLIFNPVLVPGSHLCFLVTDGGERYSSS